jgi:hypothetical protein
MKRKIIFFVTLLIISGLVAMQSCKKAAQVAFEVHHSFTAPTIIAPANDSTVTITGTTVDLTWTSTNADGATPLANVYFGTSSTPPLYASDVKAMTLTVPVVVGKTYNWNVTMIDANGVMTNGPIWSFTIFDPIAIFTGSFNVAEPVDVPHYTTNFTKLNDSTIVIDNYWDSGWAADFIINFAKKTYHMPLTTWGGGYAGIESGTINTTTGAMTGTYNIYQPYPTVIENGPHTYTK